MHENSKYLLPYFLFVFLLVSCDAVQKEANSQPNILIIYADDMGYGDLNIQNEDSKIPTPHLDQLAKEGLRFTDAHSSSGICSPSRFALLTGQYHWRRTHGIVGPLGPSMFKAEDYTLAEMLKEEGYHTACIGKWHLGWDWEIKEASEKQNLPERNKNWVYPEQIDWSKPVKGGPLDHGFDYYFGDGTINFPPYAWVENDQVTATPTEMMDSRELEKAVKEGAWEFRPGPKVPGWQPYEVLPTLTKKVISWIENQKQTQPFFLYFALPSPHAPIIPNDEFDGKSEAGFYGDFVYQTDHVVGKILEVLRANGLEENTLVLFSSDNGPEKYAWERALKYQHYSSGPFKGLKRDVWEGGHHVPMIARWPKKIGANTVSNELISQIDLMPTIAGIIGIELSEEVAIDGLDFSSLFLGAAPDAPIRKELVHNTYSDIWGLRQGDWVFINGPSGNRPLRGENQIATHDQYYKQRGFNRFETPGLLFKIKEDLKQNNNLYATKPEQVELLSKRLEKLAEQAVSK